MARNEGGEMKLRNKKTGEIIDADFNATISGRTNIIIIQNGPEQLEYNSLAELNAEWEDVPEEPKEYWHLSGGGEVRRTEDDGVKFDKYHKEIGNYFGTKEEAELAVRKLRAWKRLKDKGFRFETLGFDRERVINGRCNLIIKATFNEGYSNDIFNLADLDLLFGGKDGE